MAQSEETLDDYIANLWRKLGYYYDRDDKAKQYRLVGSRAGLGKFAEDLLTYAADPEHNGVSEHEHYGPYYLEVMTWSEAGIDGHSIYGTLDDLRRLAALLKKRLDSAQPDDCFVIGPDYAPQAEYSIHFEVMDDGFDPASLDSSLNKTIQ